MDNVFLNKGIKQEYSNIIYYFLLFVFWPFLAFIVSLINYRQSEARRIVYIFIIYYGFTFVIANIWVDSNRYALELRANALLPFSEILNIFKGLYSSGSSVDILEPLISFLISRFTNNSRFLFAAYAALFGFFYLSSINLLYNRYKNNPGIDNLIHFVFFIFILPITYINGIRMWTAAWIFFYGAYHVVLHHDKRYFVVTLAASFMHFSFIGVNGLLIIYYLLGNRNLIYIPLSIISFAFPLLLSPIIQFFASRIGGAILTRYDMYTDEQYVEAVQSFIEEVDWFLIIGDKLLLYYLLFAIIYIKIFSGKLMLKREEQNLFSFLLLFISFVNFGKTIPSLGDRFQIVLFLFATLYVFLYFNKVSNNKISLLSIIGFFPMLLYAAISFRQGADSINAWLFAPGLGLPLLAPDLSLADLLFN